VELWNYESTAMRFAIGGSEKMTIDSSGNVGIGTSVTGDAELVVYGADAATIYKNTNTGTGTSDGFFVGLAKGNGTDAYVYQRENTNMIFGTNNTERMRIDSNGNLLVGTTSSINVGSGSDVGVMATNNGGLVAYRSNDIAAFFGRQSSGGDIVQFRESGTTVGSIGVENDDLTIGTGDTGLQFRDASDAIRPFNISTNAARDASIDLGRSTERFRSLFLSGGVYLGGTSSANKMDDYEEGTWTPTFSRSGTAPVYSASTASGSYTKIGNVVHIQLLIVVSSVTTSGSGNLLIGGLPFANGSNSYSSVLNVGYNDTFDAAIKDCYVTGSFLQFIPTGITQSNYGGVLSTGYCSVTGTYITT
jgi:hypothetical protein